MRICGMLTGISISLSPADRVRLVEIAADRNSPQKHVWRTQIVLLSADGVGTNEIMRVTGTSKTCVWRWQQRFMEAGVDGLLVDKTRPSRIPPLADAVTERVVALTLTEPPGETTHWTAAAVATACSISVSSVHRIWRSHGLRPHQIRQFKLSNDPQFAAKVRDIVGLYVNPPEHAVVLSVDEKSQIQALDRTQPGLPLKKGRCGTLTHDYKRNGTTTLFAAFNVLEGSVIGRCMQRHTHQEFIRFLNAIENQVPGSSQQAGSRRARQLCHPQAPQGRPMAWSARALHFPLHADLLVMDQRRRRFLRQADQPQAQTRRVPLHRCPADCHQPLRQRSQPEPKALPLDQGPGRNHCSRPPRAPSVRFAPLVNIPSRHLRRVPHSSASR